ncbi:MULTISPECIES: L,D-transpeptidase [Mycolicibacterium]|uniref:L,D-transpeptidase n=1 Tax=Mycolicibacterium TaxID=1866885 RepID=UPI000568082C|nr:MULTISPECIES: L,D-transpeptidase [Mycolicibacterium]WND54177.1 L,D-transpeptidase [Mycolicibacterium vanbaalenii]
MLRARLQQTRSARGGTRRIAAVLGCAAVVTGVSLAGPVPVGSAGSAVGAAVASVSPAPGETVGVAHPVTVTFAGQVPDRAAAERAVNVVPAGASAPAAGSFTWLDDRVVEWTPAQPLPAHTAIGVSVGAFATGFETGASVVSVADIGEHTFTVSIDGVVARQMPASMGKPRYPTPTGQFTALEKQRYVTFDSRTIGIPLDDPEGYLIKGEYGVRVTWGGVYVHSAPWSVGSQGYANVSHGCINLSPDNAAWYFDTVGVGDPIIVQA